MKHIYVIIPVHNRLALTKQCLSSVEIQDYENKSVIVIDDGSNDGTYSCIKTKFPQVQLLRGDGNLWWGGATNLGIITALKEAKSDDFILLLNNDLIIEKDYITKIIAAADVKPESIIGSVEVHENSPNKINSGGVRINWLTAKHHNLNQNENISHFPKGHFETVSVLTGRGTLYPISIFYKVGLFDNRIIHRSDYDLPRRANLEGFNLLVHYGSVVKTISDQEEGSFVNTKRTLYLTDIPEFFTGINSNFNLKHRWFFSKNAFHNYPRSFVYFFFDTLRVLSYLISHFSFSGSR